MGYTNEGLMRSANAYQILKILMKEKSCSEDLETSIDEIRSRSSLRNLLRKMENAEIIKQSKTPSGEDKRKKFYTVNLEGLFNFWINSLRSEVEQFFEDQNIKFDPDELEGIDHEIREFNPDVEKSAGLHRSQLKTSKRVSKDQHFSLLESLDVFKYAYGPKDDLFPFFRDYVVEYLNFNLESTIHNMLVNDLRSGLTFSDYSSKLDDYNLKNLLILLNFVSGTSKGIRAVDIAIENIE